MYREPLRGRRKADVALLCVMFGAVACNSSAESADSAAPLPPPPATITDRSQLVEYYVALGTKEPVANCIADVLMEYDITSLDQLEADQTLGEEAAKRFEICSSTNGERSTT